MSKKTTKPPHIIEKMNKLKRQQENWISERKSTLSSEQKTKKQDAAMLWSTNAKSEYNGFVVRKGVSTPDAKNNRNSSRPQSAVSAKSTKQRQVTSTPVKNKVKNGSSTNNDKLESKIHSESFNDDNNKLESKVETTDKDSTQDSIPDSVDSECYSQSELTASSKFSPTSSVSIHTYREGLEEELASLNFNYTNNNTITKNKRTSSIMQNHLCQICDSLMMDEHRPKILIPCGHSFCALCISQEKVCPSCRNEIESIEENHLMARVIKQSQVKRDEEEKKQKRAEGQKYIDEYNALNTRTDTMKDEAEDIIRKMENITHEILERKETVRTLVEQGGEKQKIIEQLQNEMKSLEKKCKEESESINSLEDEYEKNKKQLIMAEKTLKTLRQSKERVKMIASSLLPDLELED